MVGRFLAKVATGTVANGYGLKNGAEINEDRIGSRYSNRLVSTIRSITEPKI